MEIWDAYYADGTLAGRDLVRGEAVPDGLYHMVCEILVRHTDDGSFLLMRRDLNKTGWPGLYEATAGGSALKGESPLEGALRELKEETGISANGLTQIYRIVSNEQQSIYYGFLYVTDCEKTSVTLQEGETISYFWLEKAEFLEFIKTDKYIQEHRNRLSPYLEGIN